VTEFPSRRHEPQVLIADAARSVAVVSLLGEHDITTADEVRNTLASLLHGGTGVVVDLTETAFVDCSIMHVLDDSRCFASRGGGRVSFQLTTRPIVRRVFEVLGFLERWPVHGTRADAIKAVSQASRLEIADDGS
jgi:anti-anti-sigma factor